MKPLRVGIDLTGAWRPPTGIFRYAIELTKQLLVLPDTDQPIRYVLFFARTILPEFLPLREHFDAILAPTTNELTLKQLWFPAVLPRQDLDVMHYPAFPPPYLQPFGPHAVMTLHDMGPWRHPEALTAKGRWYFRTLLTRGARSCERIIAVSEHAKTEIGYFLGNRYLSKVDVIPEAARPEFAQQRSTTQLAETRERLNLPERFFLAVATLEPRKNLVMLMAAYAQLRRERGDCPPLVVVGRKGWNFDDIVAYANELQGDVRFPGFVTDDDLITLYQMAACLVYPSLYEGFGLPVLEAMSAGCCVISSNTSSLPEVTGDAALLVDPLDRAAIAAAMRRVLEEHGLRDELIAKGRAQAARFTWSETARMTRDTYLRAAGIMPTRATASRDVSAR